MAWFTLGWSAQYGRLSIHSAYDDVSYLADGMGHAHRLRVEGVVACATELFRHPPHSPLMCVCAMIGFLCIGMHDWAPYAVHAGVLFLVLWCVSWMARHAGLIARSAIVLAAALLPISLQSILEFRPDAAAGFFTAFGCVFIILRLPLGVLSMQGFRIVGLAALALLAKPTVFPATLALFGLACAVSITAERLAAGPRVARSVGSLVLASLRLLGVTAIIVAPHYLVAAPKIVRYISETLFSPNADVWSFGTSQLSLGMHLLYYLRGEKKLIGWAFYPGLALGIGTLISAHVRGTRRARFQAWAIAGMVLAAYLIVALNKAKTPFLGITFFAFLTAAVITGIVHVATANRLKGKPTLAAALPCAMLLTATVLFRVPPSPILSITPTTKATDSAIRELLARTIQCSQGNEPLAFFPHIGHLSGDLLQLEALKAGVVLRTRSTPFETDLAVYAKWLDASQMVVIADVNADMLVDNFPVTSVLQQVRGLLDERRDFALEMERTTPSGGRIALFVRRPGTMKPDAREPGTVAP